MSGSSWFEETPSKETRSRVVHAADRELERYHRIQATVPRRRLFSIFSAEFLAAIPVAGVAAVLGFWLVSENKTENQPESVAANLDLTSDPTFDSSDVELVAELDFLEELELLEVMKDEDLTS